MADERRQRRLADYGLSSERLLHPGKPPGAFEQEVEPFLRTIGLTTIERALAWAQTRSMWPAGASSPCR